MIELNRKTIFLLVAMPTTAALLYWLIKTSREGRSELVIEGRTLSNFMLHYNTNL